MLNLLNRDKDMVTIRNSHAFRVDNVLICICSFLIEAEFQFLETRQVVESKHQCARLGGFLDRQAHVGDLTNFLDAPVDILKALVKRRHLVISLGPNAVTELVQIGLRRSDVLPL